MRQVDTIVGILDGWPTGKLTWDALINSIAGRMGTRPSRTTLGRHEKIQVAFQTRKVGLRKEASQGPDDRLLAQRLRRVMAENARLREQNERYREQLRAMAVQRLQARPQETPP